MLKRQSICYLIKRWKHGRDHWSVVKKKRTVTQKALNNFDDFYGSVYGTRWKSIRIALLSEHKYIALVNNFGDTDNICTALENDGAINVRSIYNIQTENATENDLNTFYGKNVSIDTKLNRYAAQQQQDELESIYPDDVENLDAIADKLNEEKELKTKTNRQLVDYKKSLKQTIEEDSQMDHRRIIDSTIGDVTGLHEFIPATKIKGMEDFMFESEHYRYYKTTADFPLTIEKDTSFIFPENLQFYTYEKGNVSTFIRPKRSITNVYSHFLMDGASILPPLMLNVQPGEKVLDACAAPGGKSLIILQSMYPDFVVCNDVQENRIQRIYNLFRDYFIDFDENWLKKRCFIRESDACTLNEYGMYDKILVDVPCTTDRHSLLANNNNIFKSQRIKERLKLPELQAALLTNCIQLLKPGGSLIYSTCSLSPIQNDGVVHMALSKVFTEYNITVTISDLSPTLFNFSNIFKFENSRNLKYGQLVLPYLPANFGPMYFSKLTRN